MSEPPPKEENKAEGEVELTEEERAARTAKNRAKKLAKKKSKAAQKEAAASAVDPEAEEANKKKIMEMMMPRRKMKEKAKEHTFWNTQPVMQADEHFDPMTTDEGAIDEDKQPSDVRQEPYDLPEGMEWWTPDVTNAEHMRMIYELLRDHYVEDDDAMFRFDYPEEFLLWALLPPNHIKDWHVAIRTTKDKSLVGFISGIPVKVSANKKVVSMCEINFLCVNKRTRDKKLAPKLISEVTRRVNLTGIWQAVYTAGIVITSTIAQCQYWHRSLNPQKLISIGFSRIPSMFEKFSRPMEQVKKHYGLKPTPQIPGIRPMVKKDHKKVRVLLEKYFEKFAVHFVWTNDEICHWFLPKAGVIDTYVVQDKEGNITDLCSFYTLPSTVIGSTKYKKYTAAYCFYNVANSVPLKVLLTDAMILAKQKDFDVFNALDVMENKTIFSDLKFGVGDGHLRYYFYNWRFPEIKPENVGIVLL